MIPIYDIVVILLATAAGFLFVNCSRRISTKDALLAGIYSALWALTVSFCAAVCEKHLDGILFFAGGYGVGVYLSVEWHQWITSD